MGDAVGKIKFKIGLQGKDQFQKEVKGLTNEVNFDLKQAFLGLGKVIVAAFSVKAVLGFLEASRGALKYTIEQQTKLEAVMRSRLGATHEEIDAIRELNSELQKTGLIEDDIAAAGAAQLARFTSNAEVLKNLIPTMQNLAVANGGFDAGEGDVTGAATVLGKALNSGNVALLARQGIVFSEAEEAAFKVANELERSEMLTRKIESTFGDINSALGNSIYGKTVQIKNAWGDMQENIGRMLDSILYPMYDVVLNIVNALVEATDKMAGMMESFFGVDTSANKVAFSTGVIADNMEETAGTAEKITKTAFGFDNLNKLQGGALAGGGGGKPTAATLKQDLPVIDEAEKKSSAIMDRLNELAMRFIDNTHIKNGTARVKEAAKNLSNSLKDVGDKVVQIIALPTSREFVNDIVDISAGVAGAVEQGLALAMNATTIGLDVGINPLLEAIIQNSEKLYGIWKSFKETLIDPIIDGVNGFLNRTNEKLTAFIEERIPGLQEKMVAFWTTIIEWINFAWENVVLPMLEGLKGWIDSLFEEGGTLDQCIDKVMESFAVILENSEWFAETLGPIFAGLLSLIMLKIELLVAAIMLIIEGTVIWFTGIMETVAGVFEMLQGVWEGDWEKIGNGFKRFCQGLLDIFVNSWLKPLLDMAEAAVNGVIGVLNTVPGVNIQKTSFASDFKGINIMDTAESTTKKSGFAMENSNQYSRFGQPNSRYGTEKFEITNVVQLDGKTVATNTNNINNRNKSTFGNSTFQNMSGYNPAFSF